jgi:hypothetical protein
VFYPAILSHVRWPLGTSASVLTSPAPLISLHVFGMEEPAIMLVLIVTRECCRGSIVTPSRRNIANVEELIFYFRCQMTPLGLDICRLKFTFSVIN